MVMLGSVDASSIVKFTGTELLQVNPGDRAVVITVVTELRIAPLGTAASEATDQSGSMMFTTPALKSNSISGAGSTLRPCSSALAPLVVGTTFSLAKVPASQASPMVSPS